jgi:hypothetical protein
LLHSMPAKACRATCRSPAVRPAASRSS